MILSRNKGSAFERRICKELNEVLGIEFCRTPGSGAFGTVNNIRSLQGDIICSDEDFHFPYFLELKKYVEVGFWENIHGNKTAKINGWLDKMQTQQTDKVRGVLLFAENRKKPIVFVEQLVDAVPPTNGCLYRRNGVTYKVEKASIWYDELAEELL